MVSPEWPFIESYRVVLGCSWWGFDGKFELYWYCLGYVNKKYTIEAAILDQFNNATQLKIVEH